MNKIGFACKLSEIHPKKGLVSIPEHNFGTTTISWLDRQTKDNAVKKLWSLMEHNLKAAYNLVDYVSKLHPELRMVRMGSDVLPAYSHKNWDWFYKQADVQSFLEKEFIKVGNLAKANDVRLSMHPGQFTVLASASDNIVEQSIKEFEYHVDMARWMGYGKTFQDFKINVHISGKRGPEGIRSVLGRLSPEARNTITIENEEISWGLDDCLTLIDVVPIVLDVHHHWIHTGEYINSDDERIKKIIDSWRGIRPVIHYSVSREEVLVNHGDKQRPQLEHLLNTGFNKQKLRAHSDWYWNDAVNDWALTHSEWADIMCESKYKNLASFKLHESRNNKYLNAA